MTQHTPGPWEYLEDACVYAHHDGVDEVICNLSRSTTTGNESLANSRLIAAAPDLAEALAELLGHRDCPVRSPEADAARAALAKAGLR